MKILTSALFLLLSGAGALAQSGPPAEAAKCQSCHDTAGPSIIPRLNGQRADYILARLRDFHDPASQTPHATYFMWDTATSLGAAKANLLASYFASLPVTPARPAGRQGGSGKKFYHGKGGCQACHGAEGEGGAAAVPRLAGQHNLYLKQQLESLGLLVRYQARMVPHSRNLSLEQVEDLAAYLGSD